MHFYAIVCWCNKVVSLNQGSPTRTRCVCSGCAHLENCGTWVQFFSICGCPWSIFPLDCSPPINLKLRPLFFHQCVTYVVKIDQPELNYNFVPIVERKYLWKFKCSLTLFFCFKVLPQFVRRMNSIALFFEEQQSSFIKPSLYPFFEYNS